MVEGMVVMEGEGTTGTRLYCLTTFPHWDTILCARGLCPFEDRGKRAGSVFTPHPT